jgi:hypothetical protein
LLVGEIARVWGNGQTTFEVVVSEDVALAEAANGVFEGAVVNGAFLENDQVICDPSQLSDDGRATHHQTLQTSHEAKHVRHCR